MMMGLMMIMMMIMMMMIMMGRLHRLVPPPERQRGRDDLHLEVSESVIVLHVMIVG
jgi:hypothetical protein